MKVLRKKKKLRMKKKKKRKRKLRRNRLMKNPTRTPKMLSRKHQHQKVWRKPILDHCWPEVPKPGITAVVAVIIVQEDPAKTSLTLDHGKCIYIAVRRQNNFIDRLYIFRYGTSGYKSPSYQSHREADTAASGSKYLNNSRTEPAPRFTSRFLKNKSIQEENPSKSSYSSDNKYTSDKGLSRSRTSANIDEDLQDDTNTSPYSPYSKTNYGSDLSRSRSSHTLKSRETSPDRPITNSSGT